MSLTILFLDAALAIDPALVFFNLFKPQPTNYGTMVDKALPNIPNIII